MGATESLRREHQILRAKLKLLAVAMQMGPDASFVLREICWSLARMLEQHIQREAEALRPYSNRIQALTQARMAQDHADQQVVLRDVNALLLGGINAPVGRVVPPLAHLIEELREHMNEEEYELFPVIDRIAAEQSQESRPSHGAAGGQDHCEAAERCAEIKA
jgi:hemerythrin-like domain-containing protein